MNMSKFPERLSDLLSESELTPTTLGEKIGTSRVTINRYLSGARYPTVEYLITIADFFNCTVDYLLGLDDDIRTTAFVEPPPFSEHFLFLCNHFNVTRYEVRKQTGISMSCIYTWQSNPKYPSLENILRLSHFFDCPVDFVIGRIRE